MGQSETERSLAALKGLYAAFEAGDVGKALEYVDPEIVITYPPSTPMAGEWRGHEGLFKLFGEVAALWVDRVTVVDAFIADGDRVVVLVTTRGKVHGRELVMPIAELYRLRDGRIIEGHPHFWDTAAIAEAVAASSITA